jgi:hypothetical protein
MDQSRIERSIRVGGCSRAGVQSGKRSTRGARWGQVVRLRRVGRHAVRQFAYFFGQISLLVGALDNQGLVSGVLSDTLACMQEEIDVVALYSDLLRRGR